MEKIPDLYQIKWRRSGSRKWNYGIVDRYRKEANAEWENRRMLLVEDAITPKSEWVSYDRDEVIPIKCDSGNEFDQYVKAEFQKAQETSKNATGLIGKMFYVGVADGSAHYVVVKENKKTLKIEWRGFCLDRYIDAMMGYGGTFPKDRVERLIRGQEGLAAIFAKARAEKELV